MAIQPIRTKLKIVNPEVSDSPRTYLTTDVEASPGSGVDLTILSKQGFYKADRNNKNFYVLTGDYNQEKTEIKKITADDNDNKVLAIEALSNSHSASDPVTVIDYNQIVIYGSTMPGGVATLIATINIDPTQSFTEYVYEYYEGTGAVLYSYFKTAFYNAQYTEESEYSEEVEGSSFSRRSIKRIIESAAIKALTKIEESPTSVLHWNNAIEIVQDGVDEIINRKRNWPFWRKINSTSSTEANVKYTDKPADNSLMEFVKVDGQKVDYVSRNKFLQLTAYQNTPDRKGLPAVYTDKDGVFYFEPTPDKVYPISYEYYYIPTTLTELSDTVELAIVPILIYYCAAMFAFIRGNDKRGDKMYAMFTKLLEQQVEEYTGPEQLGDAESIETTNPLFFD